MARKIKPATVRDVARVRLALAQLRDARDNLRAVGASRALARVRLAITSTEGALRHVQGRHDRAPGEEGEFVRLAL